VAITVPQQGETVNLNQTSKAARIALALPALLLAACATQAPTDAHSQPTSGATAVEASSPVPEPAAIATISPEAVVSGMRYNWGA